MNERCTLAGPWEPGIAPRERGDRALRLTKACAVSPDARPVAIALGRCAEPEGLARALQLFEAMPSLPRQHVIARYATLSRGRP